MKNPRRQLRADAGIFARYGEQYDWGARDEVERNALPHFFTEI